MISFFIKKNFCDGWDNVFWLILSNILCFAIIIACYFAGSWILQITSLPEWLPITISILLLGALLLLSMVGCLPSNNQAEGTTPATTTENTTPEATTPEATTPEAETTTPEETTPDATTPPENNPENPPTVGEELDKNSTLVWVLSDFWTSYDAIIDWHKSSLADKVAKIKDGTQALHVFFDPSNYYYVAGYYNPTHS